MNELNKEKQENISSANTQKNEQELNVQNPFNADDDKKIMQEDIDKEQLFKEAQTERD